MAGRAVVAERGQLRLQLLPLELGREDEGVGGAVRASPGRESGGVMPSAQTSGQPSARKRWACVRNSPLHQATTGEPV
jgi:hypothetical protein